MVRPLTCITVKYTVNNITDKYVYKRKEILSITEQKLKMFEMKQGMCLVYVQSKNDLNKIGLNLNGQ